MKRSTGAAGLALWLAVLPVGAQESIVVQPEQGTTPSSAANRDEALQSLTFQRGFVPELVAASPLVEAPFDLCFDERGRLFVLELRDFPGRSDEKRATIRLLEDADNDGRYDTGVVFAEELARPTGLFWYRDGLFVIDAPDLLFLKDANGDGIADSRRTVFSGFATPEAGMHLWEMPNSLRWGLDNRIYGLAGSGGGELRATRNGNNPVELRGRGFSFDPRTFDVQAETGRGGFGLSFDNRGRQFVSGPDGTVRTAMYDLRYALRNPYYPMPNPMVEVPGSRLELPSVGEVVFGMTIQRGAALGSKYMDDLFLADPHRGAVVYRNLEAAGLHVRTARADEGPQASFLSSRGKQFRPVQVANGPDGALHVLDLHRSEFPGEPGDESDGNDGSGRIYRMVPQGFRRPAPVNLARASTAQLVSALTHPNAWHRETAARLLYQRQDPGAVESLLRFFAQSPSPVARMHALYALDGQGALNESIVLAGLKDRDALVREHAVRLSERLVNRAGRIPDRIWGRLDAMTDDREPRVRYQLAFTLGEIEHAGRVAALAKLLRRDQADPWARAAALSSLKSGSGTAFAALWEGAPVAGRESPRARLLGELMLIAGASNRPEEIAPVVNVLAGIKELPNAFHWTTRLAEALDRGGGSLRTADSGGRLRDIAQSALEVAISNTQDESARLRAIELLGWWEDEVGAATLLEVVRVRNAAPTIRTASLAALARYSDERLPREFLQRWDTFNGEQRDILVESLLNRRAGRLELLNAIRGGRVPRDDVGFLRRRELRESGDPETRRLAAQVFAPPADRARMERLEALRPALELTGHAARGRALFEERCAGCHGGGIAATLGPPRQRLWSGRESTWENIVDPDARILDGYEGVEVQLKSREQLRARLLDDTPTAVALRRAGRPDEQRLKMNIHSIMPLERSLMPAGITSGWTAQDMADLLQALQ